MTDLNKKRCLVTGGAGFIGSHLVDKLMDSGCHVRVIDNLSNGKTVNIQHHFASPRFQFEKGSIVDPLDVNRVMQEVDVVFHLACLGVRHSIQHPFENQRVNGEGTLLLLDTAHRQGIEKFIHCSSSEIYGSAQYVPMTETHPTEPCTVYGASKLAGEAYARAYHTTYGLKTVIIRPFNTYGPRSHHEGDAGEMIPKSIVRALNGKDILIFGDGMQTRDFTYVEDTANGLIAAAKSDNMIGATLNIGSNFEISIKDLALLLCSLINTDNTNVKHINDRPGDVDRLYADPSQFLSFCDWSPQTDFETGLKKTIQFFRSHPLGLQGLLAGEDGINWSTA